MGSDFSNTFRITDHSFVESASAKYRFGGATAEEPKITLFQLAQTDNDNRAGTIRLVVQPKAAPGRFAKVTTTPFDLHEPSHVQVHIYNLQGQEVRVLVNRQFNAGYQNVVWDARDDFGNQVAAGVYVYKITTGKQT